MFRDTRVAVQKWAFFLGIPLAGELLTNSLSRIPGIRAFFEAISAALFSQPEGSDAASEAVTHPLTRFLLLVGGVVLLVLTAYLVKRRRKKDDFKALCSSPRAKKPDSAKQPSAEEETGKQPIFGLLSLILRSVIAVVIGAAIFNSYAFLGSIYDTIASLPGRLLAGISPGLGESYAAIFSGETWYQGVIRTVVGIAIGLLLVAVTSALYRNAISRKHGPIFKRFLVNGFTPWWGRWASGKNIGMTVSHKGIWQLDGYTHIPQDMRAVADVRVDDYVHDSSQQDGSIWYDRSTEPKPQKRTITRDDIDHIKQELLSHKKGSEEGENGTLKGGEVRDFLEKMDFQAALRPYYRERDQEMPADTDLRAVLELLSSEKYQEEDVANVSSDEIYKSLQSLPLYQEGGKFQRMFFERDSVGANVPLVTLDEQTRSTLRNTERYHGSEYTAPHRIKPVFIFRHLRGQDSDSVEDTTADDQEAEGEQVETAMNTIRQYRKRWNQILKKGLGQSYTLIFHGQQYTIEEEWLSSVPVGINRRVRRKFYVRLGEKIVAKIQENLWTALTKWAGNNDRIIDIYEPGLARRDAMGRVLALFTEYLASQNHYRQNRLSAAIQTRGGMEETLAGR